MRIAAPLLSITIAAAAPRHAAPAAPAAAQVSEQEREFCEDEFQMVERRRKIFEAEGLSPSEVARKNAGALQGLADCRDRYRASQRRAVETREDMAEVRRRVGADATEVEREKVWRAIRRERLGSRSPTNLTPEEKAELAAGMAEEMAATHAALDAAHARDPSFMRIVHSALACLHGARKQELVDLISSEESLLQLGTGDRQRLYALKSQLRESEEVLERSREAAHSYALGLGRCADPDIAMVTHCCSRALAGKRAEPGCESEEIQQYVRFAR